MLHTYFGISMVNLKYTHKFLICSTIKFFTSIFFICTLKFTKPPKTKGFSFKKLNICVHTPTNTGTKRQKDGHKQMYKITFLIFTNRYNVVKIVILYMVVVMWAKKKKAKNCSVPVTKIDLITKYSAQYKHQ